MRDDMTAKEAEEFRKLAGGAAFPSTGPYHTCYGMTLRDYFAAQALTGIITVINSDAWSMNQCANQAYTLADAMLREREVVR